VPPSSTAASKTLILGPCSGERESVGTLPDLLAFAPGVPPLSATCRAGPICQTETKLQLL
jgi:hypothetical protein